MKFPRSAYDKVGGFVYFPRMLDKIRLHLAGELPEDYIPLLGQGMDGRICQFLRIDYADVVAAVRDGLDDEAVFARCLERGREVDQIDRMIFNDFTRKRGTRDEDPAVSAMLAEHKAEIGLADRDDIHSFFEFFEVSEGRRD
jgi:hypothetical protein